MAARVLAAVTLILLGSLLAVPIASLLGTVALLLELVHYAWARTGLTGVRYRRLLGARGAVTTRSGTAISAGGASGGEASGGEASGTKAGAGCAATRGAGAWTAAGFDRYRGAT